MLDSRRTALVDVFDNRSAALTSELDQRHASLDSTLTQSGQRLEETLSGHQQVLFDNLDERARGLAETLQARSAALIEDLDDRNLRIDSTLATHGAVIMTPSRCSYTHADRAQRTRRSTDICDPGERSPVPEHDCYSHNSLESAVLNAPDHMATILDERITGMSQVLNEGQARIETNLSRSMGQLGEMVTGVSERISDTLDDRTLALTTSLSLGEDRLTQVIEAHTESASRYFLKLINELRRSGAAR